MYVLYELWFTVATACIHGLVIVIVIINHVSGPSTGIQGLSIHPGGARGLTSTQVLVCSETVRSAMHMHTCASAEV